MILHDLHHLLAHDSLMDEFNPYAAPKSDDILEPYPSEDGRFWCDGSLLMMTKGVQLPDRCLKCNMPAGGWTLRQRLSWHPPAYYLLIIFCNILIYIVVALIVRKTATVNLPLCEIHRQGRRRAIAWGWVLSLVGIGILVAAASSDSEYAGAGVLVGVILTLGAMIGGIIGAQVGVAKRIDDRYVWLKKSPPRSSGNCPIGWGLPPGELGIFKVPGKVGGDETRGYLRFAGSTLAVACGWRPHPSSLPQRNLGPAAARGRGAAGREQGRECSDVRGSCLGPGRGDHDHGVSSS